jgi:hypothetical protein
MVEWIKQDVKAKKIMDSSKKIIFYKHEKDIIQQCWEWETQENEKKSRK